MSGLVLVEQRKLLPYRRLKECNSWKAIRTRVSSSTTVMGLVDVLLMLAQLEYFTTPTPAFVALGDFILNGTVHNLPRPSLNVTILDERYRHASHPPRHPMESLPNGQSWCLIKERLEIHSPWVIVAALQRSAFELINCDHLSSDEVTLTHIQKLCHRSGCALFRPLLRYTETQQELYNLFTAKDLSILRVITSLEALCASNRVSLRTGLSILGIWLTWGEVTTQRVIQSGLFMTPLTGSDGTITYLSPLLMTRSFTDSEKTQLFLSLMPFLRVDERLFYARVCRAGRQCIFSELWEERAMREVLTWAVFHFDPLPISMLIDAPFHYECEGDGISKEKRQRLIDQRTLELCRNITSWHLLGARWIGRAHMVTSNKLVEEVFGRLEPIADLEITLCAQRLMHLFPGLDFRLRWSLIAPGEKTLPVPEQRIPASKFTIKGCVPWLRQTVLDSIANYEGLKDEFLIPFAIQSLLKEPYWKSRLLNVKDPFTPPMLYYWAYGVVTNRRPFHGANEILAFPLPTSIEKDILRDLNLPEPRKQLASHLELFSIDGFATEIISSQMKDNNSVKSKDILLLSLARNAVVNLADQIFDKLDTLMKRRGFILRPGGVVSEGLTRRITLARSYYSFGASGSSFFVADFCKCPLGFLLYC